MNNNLTVAYTFLFDLMVHILFFAFFDFALEMIPRANLVITFYSPSCLGQERAKGHFGFRAKLRPAHLSSVYHTQ